MKRSGAVVLLAAGAALLPACGGGGSSSPTPPGTTPDCLQTILFQGSGALGAGQGLLQPFTVTSTVPTRLDVIVDWSSPVSPIAVYVAQGTCTGDQLNAGGCTLIARSEPSQVKPRRVTVSNIAPGNYALAVLNAGPLDEGIAAQVVVSSATCPPLGQSGAKPGQ
jgi:hypothetical protein